MNRINLLLLLDRLEEMIDGSTRVPLTDKALIDGEEALELIRKIREALPEEVRQAEWLSAEQERVLQQGRAEAERIRQQAEEYANRLVGEHELVKAARLQSQKIVEEANQRAAAVQKGANEYVDNTLGVLESRLEKIGAEIAHTLQQIRNGREELRKGS